MFQRSRKEKRKKAENSKVSLTGLDDTAKRNEQAKMKKFDAFEQEATDVSFQD